MTSLVTWWKWRHKYKSWGGNRHKRAGDSCGCQVSTSKGWTWLSF